MVSGLLIKMHLKIWQITYGIVFCPIIGNMKIITDLIRDSGGLGCLRAKF